MTAGKNQSQPIILKAILLTGTFRRTPLRFEIAHELVLRRIESCPSTQSINGFESGGRNQPWSRVAGYSTPRPHAQRSRKGLVHGLFGDIEISEQARQRSKNPARFGPVKRLYGSAELFGNILRHARQINKQTHSTQLKPGSLFIHNSIRGQCAD
jgi:hypothetical protein